MKLFIPALMIAGAVLAAPAFAQTPTSGNSSNPATAATKDDSMTTTKRSKKHMASASHRHHTSRSQTTGSGSTNAPGGVSVNKDETAPKSRY